MPRREIPGSLNHSSHPEEAVSTEIELKLAARTADLPVLQQALEQMARGSRPSRSKLVSTYYDTAERTLQHDGLSLRVRVGGGRFVQTVKTVAESGGGFARGEWEDRIKGEQPDRHAPHSGRFLASTVADGLQPLFTTEVTRVAIDLAPVPATRIEAAIDRGKIRSAASHAEDRISELELELKSGEVAALYDVALRLLDVAPLRIEPDSKSQRGYRLLDGGPKPAKAVHAEPIVLDRAMRGDAVLRQIGLAWLDHLLRNETAAAAGQADGLHQMRVAARRLRAVLSAFGKLLPAEQRRQVSVELRWLADALGAARNLDVFASTLLRSGRAAFADPAELKELAAAAERQRQAAYAEAVAAIRSTRYTAAMLRLLRWFDASGWDDRRGSVGLRRPIGEIAAAMLERCRRRVRRRSGKFGSQSAKERHRLRIALKKLRYTSEAVASLYDPAETDSFSRRLKRLQDDLGDANDVNVGTDIVAALAQSAENGDAIRHTGQRLLDWHKQRLAHHEPELRQHLRELRRATPFWRSKKVGNAAAP